MTNIRGRRLTILRTYWYYTELMVVFVIGGVVGWYANKTYYMIDNYLNAEPINYLCKSGRVYEQADPTSTVYIKTNKECIEGV